MNADALKLTALPGRGRIILAYSGGPDSVCLLHRLLAVDLDRELVCVHVDHGLDADSGARAARAVGIARRLGVACRVVQVKVDHGPGPEAAARLARYHALGNLMAADETLLTAHHADDQTETVLLRLIRGAGPEGLAGMRTIRRFGQGWLARPLLTWQRQAIEGYLTQHALDYIHDPANVSPQFDRNHLRHHVLPMLRERWPAVDQSLRRSARLCRGAADSLTRQLDQDLDRAGCHAGRLDLNQLSDDTAYYRAQAIRAWCIRLGFQPPPGRRLDSFLLQIKQARADRCPELRWDQAILRLWRGRLWLAAERSSLLTDWCLDWSGETVLELPDEHGELRLAGADAAPLALQVHSGRQRESLRPAGDAHHRDCNHLLAAADIPPWQRRAWPRLRYRGQLVALGDRWQTAEFRELLTQRGQTLVWTPGKNRLG